MKPEEVYGALNKRIKNADLDKAAEYVSEVKAVKDSIPEDYTTLSTTVQEIVDELSYPTLAEAKAYLEVT